MRGIAVSNGHIVRLDLGEEVLSSLSAYFRQHNIIGATVMGIGTVKDCILGYFDLASRQYLKRAFPDAMELISFSGNLSWVEEEPFVHAHATISGADFLAHSGHFFRGQIAATGEFFIYPFAHQLKREVNVHTGLNLLTDNSF